MVKTPLKVCAFCGQTGGGELGGLRNTTDKSILAHYNCLIFSPLVFTTDDEDDPQFVIASVRAEIKRGKSLKCSYCKQHGATIGCEVKRCQKTYHYECVEKDKGTRDDENYHVYCAKHIQEAKTDSDAPEETEGSKTPDEPSTQKETARCSYCKRKGPTIGCVIETCRKTYHLGCVEKDEGVLDTVGDDQHVAYCFKHAEKDHSSPEGSERSETPDSPSTSYTTSEKKTRKSTPGKFSTPRAEKKNSEQDEEWTESEHQSTSGTRPLGKRTRSSTPGNFSSPRAKKRNAIEDTDSSGSSEQPSTSGARSSRARNRSSDLGDYSPSNNKRIDAEEVYTSRSSSSSSASDATPARKMKRKSSPRQIFKQTPKRTRGKKNVEDQQTDTKSASPVKPKARRGRPPSKKKGQVAASSQKKSKPVASEDEQKSDGDAEGEEMSAQDSGEEMDVRATTAEVESPKRRSTRLSQTIKDTCIPSTSQARFDVNESYFTKLYESQCKIANSIESGVIEFRNFAQQFQTSFKQFLEICQSLKHGICSNITNGQNISVEVHHRPGVSPNRSPSHANSHSPSSIIDSADDADTNIGMLSSEHTPTTETKEPSKDANDGANDANDSANDADTNIDALLENTPTSDGKEPSRDADSANDVDTNMVTLPSESTPPYDTKESSQKTNGSASDADIINMPSPENTPRKTRSSLAGKSKRR